MLEASQEQEADITDDKSNEDYPVGGIRSLGEIYDRCNIVVFEQNNFGETVKSA